MTDKFGAMTGEQQNDSQLVFHEAALKRIKALEEALEDALEWIDAVPSDTVLPAMPGFDRDVVDGLLASKLDASNVDIRDIEYQRERAAAFATAVGLARHHLDTNNVEKAKEALDRGVTQADAALNKQLGKEVKTVPMVPKGVSAERYEALLSLESAVRSSLQGMPDHPWIPGASVGPVVDAVGALDQIDGNQVVIKPKSKSL